MQTSPIIEAENVSFQVQEKIILDNVSFVLGKEQIVTLIGPNGAGKSTLVKLVLGLHTPTAGSITRKKDTVFGYVPQRLSLEPSMPLKVSRFLSLAQVSKKQRNEALEILDISHLAKQQMHNLSGGELQRVMLARAVSRNPDLLVLDEPLQGVDVAGQIELYRLIASLREQLKCGIFMVSHDLHLVMAQTDSVLCLNQHLCCHGQPESVSQHPEYLKLFGKRVVDDIAVYQHKHDHHHNLHGEAVNCGDECKHD